MNGASKDKVASSPDEFDVWQILKLFVAGQELHAVAFGVDVTDAVGVRQSSLLVKLSEFDRQQLPVPLKQASMGKTPDVSG